MGRRAGAGRTTRAALSAVVAAAIVATGCGGGGSSPGGGDGPADGGVLRMGTTSSVDSVNPFVGASAFSYAIWQNVYPSLVQYGTSAEIEPDFAERWKTSGDGRTWTFTTRTGATWSDGTPLTARDVAWTLETMLAYADGPAANWASRVAGIASVEAVDDTTVRVRYERPLANVLSQLQGIPILPRHVWEPQVGDDGSGLKRFAVERELPMVGGGPFVLEQFRKKDVALLARNPEYYGDTPHLDGFGLRYYATDDALATALDSGELDAVDFYALGSVEKAERNPELVTDVVDGLETDFLAINSSQERTEHPELRDPAVREAMDRSIDRDQIIEVVYDGMAEPATSLFPPSVEASHDPSLQPVARDLERANELLDEAGFERGPDGVRLAGGEPMRYTVLTPSTFPSADRLFSIIRQGFEEIGIELELQKLDSSALLAEVAGPDGKQTGYDMVLWNWLGVIDPDFMLSVDTCGQLGAYSITAYCNPRYDALYERQARELDPKRRQQLVFEAQRMLAADRPYLFLAWPKTAGVHRTGWDGFERTAGEWFTVWGKRFLEGVHRAG